ncbi:MAG: MoxR family ATPase [Myxococcales bacterium]|nr:MoxR family ATPase [Myxococcales bacterium]
MAPGPNPAPPFADVDEAVHRLEAAGYACERSTAVATWLAGQLGRPLLVEGPAGVGKTELAKAIARATGRELVRLQCYEGLDEAKALYEWEYGKQLLVTQLLRDVIGERVRGASSLGEAMERLEGDDAAFFHERFLIARPLLQAIRSKDPVVLLVDEVDRGDPEFEAMLLEVLSDFQVTIPELGTLRAKTQPLVVLTSNATRDVTDALRRRCLHVAMDYPERKRELALLRMHVPDVDERLAEEIVDFVGRVRDMNLRKAPGISEVVDWARTLVLLGARSLSDETLQETLGALTKYTEDREAVARNLQGEGAPARPRDPR